MTDDERKELSRRPPWVGARIIDRGAPYVIVGGYHTSDERAIEAGGAPHFWRRRAFTGTASIRCAG